jgi:hypothetical protein
MQISYRFLTMAIAGSLAAMVPAHGEVALAGFWAADGTPDKSFGQSGKSVFPFPGTPKESARKPEVKRPSALNWSFEPWGETGGTSAGTRLPVRY